MPWLSHSTIIMESSSSSSSRPIMAPTVTVSGTGNGSPANNSSKPPAESITSITAHRRKRLVRSENVCCSHHQGWEAIFRESLLHMAWPISLSMSSDQADTLAMTDFLPLKIRLVFDWFFRHFSNLHPLLGYLINAVW